METMRKLQVEDAGVMGSAIQQRSLAANRAPTIGCRSFRQRWALQARGGTPWRDAAPAAA